MRLDIESTTAVTISMPSHFAPYVNLEQRVATMALIHCISYDKCMYIYISYVKICSCPDIFYSVISNLISKRLMAELCVDSYHLQQDYYTNISHLLYLLIPLQSLFLTE